MKEQKKELDSIEKALKGQISVLLASQLISHMFSVAVQWDKNLVCTLEIGYLVFFKWDGIKELKTILSHPLPLYCKMVNCSIQEGCTVNTCERLESRLKKASSNVLSKYKSLKGQHRDQKHQNTDIRR